jgi:hypothetical protein
MGDRLEKVKNRGKEEVVVIDDLMKKYTEYGP